MQSDFSSLFAWSILGTGIIIAIDLMLHLRNLKKVRSGIVSPDHSSFRYRRYLRKILNKNMSGNIQNNRSSLHNHSLLPNPSVLLKKQNKIRVFKPVYLVCFVLGILISLVFQLPLQGDSNIAKSPWLKRIWIPPVAHEKQGERPFLLKYSLTQSERTNAKEHVKARGKIELNELVFSTNPMRGSDKHVVLSEKAPPSYQVSDLSDETIIKNFLESWRNAWENKRIDQYSAHYHPDFSYGGKNRDAWIAKKKLLNQQNRKISVGISGINIKVAEDVIQATFKQNYDSDYYSDQICKRLEFAKASGDWKIYSETAVTGNCG